MIVADVGLCVAALQTARVVVCRVGRDLGAEQVQRDAVVEIHEPLHRFQIDHAVGANLRRIGQLVLAHDFAGALQHARHAGFADEHVMRFLGQHEFGGARQRIESRFSQGGQLELAVAVREEREHVERQPVAGPLIECREDARIVRIPRAPLQQSFGFLSPVAAEVAMQQVHHRPQMPPFLDIDLEQIAQVVKRRAGGAEQFLLLHGSRFGIALGYDDSPERGSIFAGNILPGRLALCDLRSGSCGFHPAA